MKRRTFLGGAAVASLPVASMAAQETLEDRITRLEGEFIDALEEKWQHAVEITKAPYGNAWIFMERD